MNQSDPIEFPADAPRPRRSTLIGDRLRLARTDRRLTLEEAEQATRIGRRYLEALELGQYEVLPAPVYARGFMRSYAAYLGLDPLEAVMAMPNQLPRPEGLEPMPGLRRRPSGSWPEFDPRLAGIAAAILVVMALLLWIAPRLGSGTGLPDLPGRGATASSGVPAFEEGTTPNFVGVDRDVAVAVIERLELEFTIVETPSATAPAGRVIQQAPEAGEPIEAGEAVTLVVSQGPPSN